MVDCLTVPLQVPAHAQIVLEGYVEPGERAPEGPFGDHTGFYTPVEPFPVLHVECMTTQRDPVYHSIVTSKPPQEDGPIGHATERIFLPLIKLLIPDIVDMSMPEPGVFHNCLIVSIRKRYPKHAQKVMNAIWGAHLLSLTKLIVVVDDDCDPSRLRRGRVPGVRQRRLRARPGASPRARSTTSTTRRTSSSGAARRASTPPASCRPRATTAAGRSRAVDVARDRVHGGPTLEGVRAVTAVAGTGRAGAGAGVPAAGHDRALGVRAAVRLPGRADRDDAARRPGRLVRRCCSITIAMVGARTFAMAANRIIDRQIDARNPRTAKRELVTGAVSRAHRVDRGGGRARRLPGRGGGAQPALPRRWPRWPWCRWSSTRTRKRFTNWPHAILGAGPADRPGRRLARRHRHAGRLRAGLGARASRSGCGSAASTSSTPARTSRSTARSACTACRPGTGSRSRCAPRPWCTW